MNKTFYRPTLAFIQKLREHPEPRYQVALKAKIRPQTFYSLCSGIMPCRPNDKRIIAAGKIVGIGAEDCLEKI